MTAAARPAAALACLLALVAAAAGPVAAAADVLVTRDGSHIETRGPWQEKRGMVVFTAASGTLSSLRLAEVDLEASAAATAAATAGDSAAPDAAPAARRQPVAVITDADIPRGRPAAAAGPEPATGEDAAAEPSAAVDPAVEALRVDDWRALSPPGFDGVQIEGTVTNTGDQTLAQVSLAIEVLDDEGKAIVSGRAFLDRTTLVPRASTSFRMPLVAIYDVGDLRITPRATAVVAFVEQSSVGDTATDDGESR